MTAIAGVLRLDDRPTDPGLTAAMLSAISHRGIVASVWTRQKACLGALTDGPAPASRADGPLLVADARIDNLGELARQLAVERGAHIEAYLSSAYQRWDTECAQRLLGDFALAVWDDRLRRLVCIRDHIGIKPLYYCHLPGQLFAFASEAKALLSLSELTVRIDETRIADFLTDQILDDDRTFYDNVRRLPPAHTLTVDVGGVHLRRFWEPDRSRTVRFSSDEEYASAFREIFTEAVHCRLERKERMGSTLSGGLDSSAVTCMARHLLDKESDHLSTFSLIFNDAAEFDERPFMASVTRACGTRANYLDVAKRGPLRHLAPYNYHNDGPTDNQFASDVWEMYSTVGAHRTTVLLDGCEGDVTISYNFRYLGELSRRLRWLSMLREVRGLKEHQFRGNASSWWLLKSYCLPPLLPSWTLPWRIRRRLRATATSESSSLVSANFAARIGLVDRVRSSLYARGSIRTHRDVHAYMLTHPMVAQALEGIDHLSAAFAIEPRHPFYDRRLVEFCLALPREQLVNHGWNRPVLRRALADLLPPEVRARGDKGGPVPPLRLATCEHRALEETGRDDEMLGRYIDMDCLRSMIRRYLDDGVASEAGALWTAVSLRQWLRADPCTPVPAPNTSHGYRSAANANIHGR